MTLTLRISKRWWFTPALHVLALLIYLRVVTVTDASRWLANHGMRFEAG